MHSLTVAGWDTAQKPTRSAPSLLYNESCCMLSLFMRACVAMQRAPAALYVLYTASLSLALHALVDWQLGVRGKAYMLQQPTLI